MKKMTLLRQLCVLLLLTVPVSAQTLVDFERFALEKTPEKPKLPDPALGAVGIGSSTQICWTGINAVSNDVYLGTSSSPSLAKSGFVGNCYTASLTPSTTYYWKVIAKNKIGSITGPVWSFSTAAPPPPPPPTTCQDPTATNINGPLPCTYPPTAGVSTLIAAPSSLTAGASSTLTLTTPDLNYHNVFINAVRPSCVYTTIEVCTLTVLPTSTTTYQAAATNSVGTPYTMPSVTVTVTGAPPPPPPPGPLPTGTLVQQANLVKVGSFSVPLVVGFSGLYEFAYANGSIAFNPANNSLFVTGHDWGQHIAEMSIPALGGTANILQPFVDALYGKLKLVAPNAPNDTFKIGGLFAAGGKLLVSGYDYYDAGNNATSSHFSRTLNLSDTAVTGPFTVGTLNPGFYAGYFAAIPDAWQGPLGGDTLVGMNGIPVVARTSYGPSAHAVKLADLLAGTNPTVAQPLVYYPQSNQTLGSYGQFGVVNPLYNGTAKARGILIPPGSSSLLFFGSTSLGPYCYGLGTTNQALNGTTDPATGDTWCYDPAMLNKGEHGYPYSPYVWAYDLNDLAQVKAGLVSPWNVKPYASWTFPDDVIGLAYDPATGRIFIASSGDALGINVYQVQ